MKSHGENAFPAFSFNWRPEKDLREFLLALLAYRSCSKLFFSFRVSWNGTNWGPWVQVPGFFLLPPSFEGLLEAAT